MRFEPHELPSDKFDWLQTGVPVVQLYVPGAQVVPQEAFGVQALQLALLSQNRFVPQDEPADFFTWLVQTAAPVLQEKVPGSQAEPQEAPIEQAAQPPLPSHTMPDPHVVPGAAFVCLQTCVPELQS
jgi:hypothetical protein